MIALSQHTINRILVLIVLFIGSKGNVLAISDGMLLIALLYSFYHFQKRGRKFTRHFLFFTGAYILITILYLSKFGWVNWTSSIRFYLKLLVGYQVIATVGLTFLLYYERFIYFFAAISLPLYGIQLISYDGLKTIVGLVENTIPGLNYRGDWYVNCGFFTLNDNAEFRNSGMAWEPKGFANMVGLAIVFNLMREKFRINKQLIVMGVALITTFSTLGYLAICVTVPLLYVINIKSPAKKAVALLLGATFLVSVLSLDFMFSKITREIEDREAHFVYIDSETDAPSVTLGRFGSMALAFHDFPKNPLIGIGMQDKERTQGKYTRLVWVSGLADFLSRFGLVGIAFLMISYFIAARQLAAAYDYKGGIALWIMFFMIFFASAVIINPLFFCFQFLPFTQLSKQTESNDN